MKMFKNVENSMQALLQIWTNWLQFIGILIWIMHANEKCINRNQSLTFSIELRDFQNEFL